jgi:hypothetical protein
MFRFSIREILLVTLVAGLALGWWVDHRAVTRRLAECTKRSEQLEDVLLDAKAAMEVLTTFQGQMGSTIYFQPQFDSVFGPGAHRQEFKPQDRH